MLRTLDTPYITSQRTTAVPGKPADVIGKLDLASSTDVLLIEETKCVRCNNCVDACAATHQGQPRLNRADGPSFARVHVPVACRHCEGTPCLQDCPVDAIMRDADGVVKIDANTCIGCGNCSQFCPFQAIFMVECPTEDLMVKLHAYRRLLASCEGISGAHRRTSDYRRQV